MSDFGRVRDASRSGAAHWTNRHNKPDYPALSSNVELAIHPLADLFPRMTDDEFEHLKADIDANGQRDPITLYENRAILDGRNRYRACRELGIVPKFEPYTGEDAQLLDFVLSRNLHRRHLTSSQKAVLALAIERFLAEEAAKRVGGRPRKGEEKPVEIIPPVSAPDQPAPVRREDIPLPSGKARQQAARMAGTNERYVSDAKRIAAQAPELVEEVRTGVISLPEAKALAKETPEIRREVIDRVKSGEVPTVRKAIQAVRKQEKTEAAQSLPQGVYNVIYADPPWQYDNTGVHGAADHHYPTMPLSDICDFTRRIDLQVAANAVLFMWVTNPFLEDAFSVVRAWGFEYKTNIVWVKTDLVKPGSGFYVRGRHELLFICTRGSFTPLDNSQVIPSVLEAPLADHSRKPDAIYSIIETLYPQCQYIELFARRTREGWTSHGNELG